MDLVVHCDFEEAGSAPCTSSAEARTVLVGVGEPAQVTLCDSHYAYVADKRHAHYWSVDRDPARARTFIRMIREH